LKAQSEAPGKVILTGEHFVVHGAWALAAAVPRVVRAEVEEGDALSVVSEGFGQDGGTALKPVSELVRDMSKRFSFSPRVKVRLSSELPRGSGLGSSAATMVAVASALSRLHGLGLSHDELVSSAMHGEREVHGRPSGIDPTTSALGGVVLFRMGEAPRRVKLRGPRRLLVSFSGESRSTKRQIGKVSRVAKAFPDLFRGLSDSVSEMSKSAADCLSTGDLQALGRLLSLNHSVLASLGLSNETLDRQVDLLMHEGCYGAKLTGAGGGGCVLGIAPSGKEKSIGSRLSARGFETFVAVLPVGGVRSWLSR
jgi:mevalonate kinase